MATAPRSPTDGISPVRMEALCDGVFAVAMTLLVFDLHVPTVAPGKLWPGLLALWPNLLSYLISVLVLGIYWLGHRAQLHYVRRADHTFHWINFIFLAVVSLIPFSARMLSAYPLDPVAIGVYGANTIAIGLLLWWHWRYCTDHSRLTSEQISAATRRYAVSRCLVAPGCYLAAILISFASPVLSLVIYACIPWLYIVPGWQKYWLRLFSR